VQYKQCCPPPQKKKNTGVLWGSTGPMQQRDHFHDITHFSTSAVPQSVHASQDPNTRRYTSKVTVHNQFAPIHIFCVTWHPQHMCCTQKGCIPQVTVVGRRIQEQPIRSGRPQMQMTQSVKNPSSADMGKVKPKL
jgi:hypothetical protein